MIPNQQPGLPTVLNKEQADIQGKAQAFLMSGDQIGFIGKLASEAPTEIAPVVNAARRMAKEAQAAQQPQGESITTAGMREVEQAKRGLSAAYELSQSQKQQCHQLSYLQMVVNLNFIRVWQGFKEDEMK